MARVKREGSSLISLRKGIIVSCGVNAVPVSSRIVLSPTNKYWNKLRSAIEDEIRYTWRKISITRITVTFEAEAR